MNDLINLQIGGQNRLTDWKRLHQQPGADVDFSGDITHLSHFADASCAKVYIAQILQQVEPQQLLPVLQGIHRILAPSGQLLISVPDLDALCKLYLSPHITKSDRLQVMRMLFGGQRDSFDLNRCGLSFEWLADCLAAAGFGYLQRVDHFQGFTDSAAYAPFGTPVCLNVLAYKLPEEAIPATILQAAQANIAGQLAVDTLSLSHLAAVLHNPPQALTAVTHVEPATPATELSPVDAAQIQQTTLKALEHQNSGDATEAKRLFKEVLDLQPTNFAALYSLAVLTSQHEEHNEALDWIRKAIATGQNYAPAFFVEAVVLQALGRFDESLVSYEQAVAVDPHYESAMINRSNLYYEVKQHVKALESFAEVLKVNPNSDKALAGQGIILTEMNKFDMAIPLFERLLKVNPEFEYGQGLLLHAEQHCCDWRRFKESRESIEQGVHAGQRVCKTLPFMSFSNSPDDLLHCVKIFATHMFPARSRSKHLWQGEKYQHDKIRLAYVSPDFREHPVGHLMAGVIEHHDKSQFETIAISLGIDDKGSLRQRFETAFSQFIDVRGKKSWEIAELIRGLEVDILVDLAGYTADSRTDVFAYRPAPIQVNYLGYPGSLGVDYLDYILADRVVIPEEHQAFYSEKVAYLPHAYLPTDSNLKIAERTPSREEMGLPEAGVVFCSFNHDYKINPPMFDVWMRLLDQVPGSVLWLMKLNEPAQHNLRREAEQRGIDPDRLIFATRVPLVEDHLARYRLADMFLDTTPYNAHTTASDCLRLGLPVVTYLGNTFSGRVAASLLQAIGLPELITHSFAEYEALALQLARDSALLASIKAKLLENQKTYPLFKTDVFVKTWNRYLAR